MFPHTAFLYLNAFDIYTILTFQFHEVAEVLVEQSGKSGNRG
jgi:hypothetical protein